MPAREPAPITLRLFSSLSIQSIVPDALGITKSCWGILACICIGSFLRIYQFWLPDLWLDEYGTWWVVSASTWSEVAERAIRTQGQSPLYYLVVKLFTGIFGEEVLQLRLPSVVFGILTLFVAFRLATRIFRDQEFVLIAVAVFSLNEQLIWFAQNARPYALALFLTLLSFNFFLHFLQLRTAWGGALYILTTALLIYSHFLFGFVLIIQVVFLALKSGSRQVFSKDWLTCFFSMALLCLPLASQLWSLYGRRQTLNWIPNIEPTFLASELARGVADPWALALAAGTLLALGLKPIALADPVGREGLSLLAVWVIIPLLGNLERCNNPRCLAFHRPLRFIYLPCGLLSVGLVAASLKAGESASLPSAMCVSYSDSRIFVSSIRYRKRRIQTYNKKYGSGLESSRKDAARRRSPGRSGRLLFRLHRSRPIR